MGQARKSSASTRMLVLGLLLEAPDTPSGIAGRMKERFASARLAQSNAHNLIKRLRREGLVSVVEGDEGRPAARIKVTDEGVTHFDAWMCAAVNSLPDLRDPTLMRLALCRNTADMRIMTETIAQEEELCDDAHLQARTKAQVIAERLQRRGNAASDWRTKLECAILTHEAGVWLQRARGLHGIRKAAEQVIREKAGEASPER